MSEYKRVERFPKWPLEREIEEAGKEESQITLYRQQWKRLSWKQIRAIGKIRQEAKRKEDFVSDVIDSVDYFLDD